MVTCDHITLFVYAQAAVCIPIIGKTHIQLLIHHQTLQLFNMGRAYTIIDIQSVRLCTKQVGFCAQCFKYCSCNIPCRTVGTV